MHALWGTRGIALLHLSVFFVGTYFHIHAAHAATIDAQTLQPQVTLMASPRSGTVVEGSTFDVSIVLNSRGSAINGIQAKVRYDASKLAIVKPSSGKSVIGVWVEPPSYDNVRGTANYVGVVPGGITADAGVVGTITFKAKMSGEAVISLQSDSEVLMHDGLGTPAAVELGRAVFTILPKPPEGLEIYSDTHPLSSEWYQNNNPVFSWKSEDGVGAYSYVFDAIPTTEPDNDIDSSTPTVAYENVADGLWYFHVKALKRGVWGNTGHYLIRIDRTAPAEFTPSADHIFTSITNVDRTMLSFATTDAHSGVSHYEVGVLDPSSSENASPVFVETQSPFQLPIHHDMNTRVIVRAYDAAGNVRGATLDIAPPILLKPFLLENYPYIIGTVLLLMILTLVLHYIVAHHILRHFRRAWQATREDTEDVPPSSFHTTVARDAIAPHAESVAQRNGAVENQARNTPTKVGEDSAGF